jgi:hypothetical protein
LPDGRAWGDNGKHISAIAGRVPSWEMDYMKTLLSLLCFCLFLGVATGQDQTPSLQPTPLEAFAGLPATLVAWSKEVGRIESGEAQAVITAVILEDTAQPPDRMRGIRINLFSRESKDQIFLGEETLSIYKNALDVIEREATREQNDGTARESVTPDGTSFVGAGLFWYADKKPQVHALNAAYYFGPGSSGLYISAFKGDGFRFPNQQASQLSQAIGRAMNELRSR